MNYEYFKRLITDMKAENNPYVSFTFVEMQINMLWMMGQLTLNQKEELLAIIHPPVEIVEEGE
ncbi:hypothetical protein [Clostridium formicaceticum]|uniref:Uncharacterized protein n=1 Tax=Clostridium formicaceticum TaxID=1497 RepID=A0AAC9WG08_9CLOT|nr:hypothetical protein [Clostridium formicaceticum]AOY76924.1 hypothetical protein BJL90_14300 [Clostridium formicaceticum]ARE87403.1 hypothetical protein CLFO_18030 [Clostridium formicaceticum]